MTRRMDVFTAAALMTEWLRTSELIAKATSFDGRLSTLIQLQASQINGYANSHTYHVAAARGHGETDQCINLLPAWREAPCYTDRELAALEWIEARTQLSEHPRLAAAQAALKANFSDEEQVKLSLAINLINDWKRLAVGFDILSDATT